MTDLLQRFNDYDCELNADSSHQPGQLYRDDVEFCDPARCRCRSSTTALSFFPGTTTAT